MRSIKWTHEGRVVCAGQYQRCTIPESLVARALAIGAVTTVGDPRVRNLIGSSGMQIPPASRCQAIDDTPETSPLSSEGFLSAALCEMMPSMRMLSFFAIVTRQADLLDIRNEQ
jgi:hypothetical protein